MHGHARLVERKIRVWIAHQELNRRKQGQQVQIDARGGEASVRRYQRVGDLPRREHWR
jgi:hypothetical protein